jgi:molecular chaperone GrpE
VSGLAPEERARLLETMTAWLDALELPEPVPEGLAGDAGRSEGPEPDLFSLLAEMAALKQETRLLGRATSRQTAEMNDRMQRIEDAGLAPVQALANARREGRMELAKDLLDVRDRLERGTAEARARLSSIPAWRLRLSRGGEVLSALVSGSTLALDRVDDMLSRLSIRRVPCEGRPFDPQTMRATEATFVEGKTPGTVVEVGRSGWLAGDAVLRYAEVTVAAEKEGEPRDA